MENSNILAMDELCRAYEEAARSPGSKKSNLIDAFIRTIENGFWQPGELMPTERQFADALPVSLGTVQSAFLRLTDAGLVQRKPGVGTRVTGSSDREGERLFLRFITGDGSSLLPADVRSATIEETTADGPWTRFLGDRPSYIRVSRLISLDGRFTAAARVYLDGTRFRPMLDFDLAVIGRLHIRQILHDRFNAPTLSRKTRVRFQKLEGALARDLAVAPGTQGIALEVSSYTLREAPLCFQRFIIPPNDFALDIKTD
ncbi:MAG: GntR family transcriptional regulator [Alphaproteobacteria bacterium]|jgi:GntR family transcriptional regulator|nr:GntR family transcriptional regulator [Alphaproteobacteria bacterium]MDP6566862.1 GntR family transcriptional regulator [Alphaproteobacteria bacterium]MDP6814556.1 GntR family transcriptional regulator [Alphaproteobacteria bacterium]